MNKDHASFITNKKQCSLMKKNKLVVAFGGFLLLLASLLYLFAFARRFSVETSLA